MAYLLDTHTILWSLDNYDKLSKTARSIIEDVDSTCYASVISFFEIAIKTKTGKLELSQPVSRYYEEIQTIGIRMLPIKPVYLDRYDRLPLYENHRDPFDRFLIATASHENLDIITIDEKFDLYEVNVRW